MADEPEEKKPEEDPPPSPQSISQPREDPFGNFNPGIRSTGYTSMKGLVASTSGYDSNFSRQFDVHTIATVTSSIGGRTAEQRALEEENLALKAKIEDLEKANKDGQKERDELEKGQKLSHILHSIAKEAHPSLRQEGSTLARDFEKKTCGAYVMSVDIRRSTDLMLKATEPEQYARFISELCSSLRHVVLQNIGVFDKFTGDGILAIFPDFFSGKDAGYLAVCAADECHETFAWHYRRNRNCFTTVLKDIGLGIGIDFGKTHLVSAGGGLTVVGDAVVYACRLAGAPPGKTLLNQRAYAEIFSKYSAYCQFDETEINLKHEGPTLAYSVSGNNKPFLDLTPPPWDQPTSTTD